MNKRHHIEIRSVKPPARMRLTGVVADHHFLISAWAYATGRRGKMTPRWSSYYGNEWVPVAEYEDDRGEKRWFRYDGTIVDLTDTVVEGDVEEDE